MPLVSPPQLIGLARVSYAEKVASYEFADGFDSDKLDGASNVPVIYTPSTGVFVLFLDNPEDPGSSGTQGGIKARVDAVSVATASNTATIGNLAQASARVEMRWYYGDYALPASYAGVNPKKAIVVYAFDVTNNYEPYNASLKFDIAVFRDPMTKFAPKQFVG